jgi:protein-L-isoaspartate(D-aspartate) O-methyltransferase
VPDALLDQLADGGKLILPVGNRYEQQLQIIRKIGGQVSVTTAELCRFVPLLGEHGWRE